VMHALRCGGALAALIVAPFPLPAQTRTVHLDAGASRMRFADSVDASAVSLSPAFIVSGPRSSFSAFGTFSRLAGSWTNSGTVSATRSTARRGRLAGEVEGSAGGSAHADGGRTGQLLGAARLNVLGVGRGAWAGASLGRTWDGVTWRGLLMGELGGWYRSCPITFSATLVPTQVDDTIGYADLLMSLQRQQGTLALGASLGLRSGDQLPTLPSNRSVWGSVGAILWMTPSVGLVANAGTYPVDLTQGYPGGQYVSISLRLRGASPSAGAASPAGRPRGSLTVSRVAGSTRRIRVYAPNARRVELFADFTQWSPVLLRQEPGGWWSTSLSIPTGPHQVNVRIDGGDWLVPPGLDPLKDEFGGASGLLVVP